MSESEQKTERQTEPQPGATKILLRVLFLVPLLIFAGTMVYLFAGLDPDRDPSAIPSAREGKPAPEVNLGAIPGGDTPGLTSADLSSDGLKLVNVFASWCVPCRAEHPLITRLAEETDVPVYGINYKDKAADALGWLAELGNPFTRIGYDETGQDLLPLIEAQQ